MQNELLRLFKQAKYHFQQSPWEMVRRGADKVRVYSYFTKAKDTLGMESFTCMGRKYSYYIHTYNATWRNERAIEIPLALEFLEQNKRNRMLELGNVSEYYLDHRDEKTHVVVDKYEKSPSVLNDDFLDFVPKVPFDAFLSISTFEHIGWDEPVKDLQKVEKALKHISRVVSDKKRVLVTFPLGYHPHLDEIVRSGQHGFKSVSYLIRNGRNEWKEVPLDEALGRPYGKAYPAANALFVGKELI